jgi:hypothetical protein
MFLKAHDAGIPTISSTRDVICTIGPFSFMA